MRAFSRRTQLEHVVDDSGQPIPRDICRHSLHSDENANLLLFNCRWSCSTGQAASKSSLPIGMRLTCLEKAAHQLSLRNAKFGAETRCKLHINLLRARHGRVNRAKSLNCTCSVVQQWSCCSGWLADGRTRGHSQISTKHWHLSQSRYIQSEDDSKRPACTSMTFKKLTTPKHANCHDIE